MRVLVACCALGLIVPAVPIAQAANMTWQDLAPLHARLQAKGLTSASFPSFVDRVAADNIRRVREGDLDHLIFYALQSTHFTSRDPIEPALSAKEMISGGNLIPPAVRARMVDLRKALRSSSTDPRVMYFRALVNSVFPDNRQQEAGLLREYTRVMRFVYDKEFVAQPAGPVAVAELYRVRGLSTDTEVEAGFVVYNGLGIVKSLNPDRHIRRVLIVGPGLDLAPRTSLLEAGPPESYQPWAVIDALISLGLSRLDDLRVVGADINPRVVDHLRHSATSPPVLTLVSGIAETATVHFSADYRDYFAELGRSIGEVSGGGPPGAPAGHPAKTVRVRAAAARALSANHLDIVTARLKDDPFDLIIATNILPYFDDTKLMLAMSNIAAMLAPGGIFMHNEPRPVLGEITAAVGMPFEQSRSVTIASVEGSATLADSIWLHRKTAR